MRKGIYYTLLAVCILVFLISGGMILNYLLESRTQTEYYDSLAEIVAAGKTEKNDPTAVEEDTGEATGQVQMLPEYAALYEMNSDCVGWIAIEGTKIQYPVVQTPETKDYYLYRDFKKADSKGGCIYVREQCDVLAPSDNITIYGHNMKDGRMFGHLKDYLTWDFYQEHPEIRFDTLYERHTYEIFAVFTTTASVGEGFKYHLFVDAADAAEFDAFVAECKALSVYDTGITPEYGDKLICLSTCEYTHANGRLVVAAVRTD